MYAGKVEPWTGSDEVKVTEVDAPAMNVDLLTQEQLVKWEADRVLLLSIYLILGPALFVQGRHQKTSGSPQKLSYSSSEIVIISGDLLLQILDLLPSAEVMIVCHSDNKMQCWGHLSLWLFLQLQVWLCKVVTCNIIQPYCQKRWQWMILQIVINFFFSM